MPQSLTTIRTSIRTAVSRQRRMAALLIRLHFHDCFVQGCDASILLNDPATTERTALSNTGVGGYDVIDSAKSAVGGPSWSVRLGRRDSTRANER
ncbi:putative plant peroxidase, heme peroxidase superfamily [Helianthus annuus]|nr:putative plant peroxidase, heme peroxidase superfamily [Helianthus annuus]